ncbi:hypothetical protein H310_14534 [Aphanomyces invadans]|uniref:ABC transmembrane type-1 domain-containing protein n=1 Tax=Aphanomyces invadans TaxID=157072 RepID=A0A024TAV4_9STRA|nr:hypothetical protein H310_14534 [Aphanomyces invadans]ETV90746.1 hypothetical protein H310_14534 [Aphanomyces invadans]|eukprot:XP_008880636.1 hypothetical protein H310_14534 [Aphanomyces invadans]
MMAPKDEVGVVNDGPTVEFTALASPKEAQAPPNGDIAWRDVPNPMGAASWFSLVTMLWMDRLIQRGAKKTLQEQDVWKLSPKDTAAYLNERFQIHWEREKLEATPDYARAIWRTLQTKTLWTTALYGLYSVLMLVQPTVIKSLLDFLQTPDGMTAHTSIGISSGYALAGLLTVLSFVSVTMVDFGQYLTSNLGVNAKSIVMDSVYLKTLRLSGFARREMSSGEIVTLSSVDSERLFQGYMVGPWVVVAPFTLLLIFILIGVDMGAVVGAVVGVSMAAVLYWSYVSSKAVGKVRRDVLTVQAERIKLTNEILQGVRVVKMYAWEGFVQAQIEAIRARELALLRTYQYQRVLNTVMLSIAPVFSLALCLAVYAAQGHELTPSRAFTALAYMNVARLPCTVFSSSIMFASEALASCARIGKFMVANEIPDDAPILQEMQGTSCDPKVDLDEASFSWNADLAGASTPMDAVPLTLKRINLSIAAGTLTIVVGPVGAGKSSLISAILGEIQQVSGRREVAGRVAYVNQEAWIQHATVRDNILFSAALDTAKYDRVVAACQLKADLAILPDGDETEIGERGINLSGGQKARVSLARAMYRSDMADLVLLDDPLSALDVHVAGAVFRESTTISYRKPTACLSWRTARSLETARLMRSRSHFPT